MLLQQFGMCLEQTSLAHLLGVDDFEGRDGDNPGMKLHATRVTLLNHPLQGIPIRKRRLTLLTCQELTPWLKTALIERIAFWSNLKDNGIYTVFLQFIQLIGQRLLHFYGSYILELPIYTLNPCTTEFTLALRPNGGSE